MCNGIIQIKIVVKKLRDDLSPELKQISDIMSYLLSCRYTDYRMIDGNNMAMAVECSIKYRL